MNILVIEHDMPYAQWLKEKIEARGFGLEILGKAQEALDRLRQKSFDLILVNIFLPDSTGPMLISEMKTISPKAGIIAMTDRNSRELEMQIRKLGILYYMIKPIDKEYLTHLLDHVEKKSVSSG
jgi:DNA-binding response OmpR family regulator